MGALECLAAIVVRLEARDKAFRETMGAIQENISSGQEATEAVQEKM